MWEWWIGLDEWVHAVVAWGVCAVATAAPIVWALRPRKTASAPRPLFPGLTGPEPQPPATHTPSPGAPYGSPPAPPRVVTRDEVDDIAKRLRAVEGRESADGANGRMIGGVAVPAVYYPIRTKIDYPVPTVAEVEYDVPCTTPPHLRSPDTPKAEIDGRLRESEIGSAHKFPMADYQAQSRHARHEEAHAATVDDSGEAPRAWEYRGKGGVIHLQYLLWRGCFYTRDVSRDRWCGDCAFGSRAVLRAKRADESDRYEALTAKQAAELLFTFLREYPEARRPGVTPDA